MNEQIEKTIKSLMKNNMDCHYFENRESLLSFIDTMIKDKDIVSVGGSQTLFQLGLIDYLRNRDITFLDRYAPNLTSEELLQIFRQAFFANVYLTSSNAITEDGMLYNVDGRGNRLAAMIFGPDKVLVIAGVNKIVKDLDEAIERMKKVAAPLNAKRLNRNTPCVKHGECMECDCSDRICRDYLVIKKPEPNRITVLLVNESLGY